MLAYGFAYGVQFLFGESGSQFLYSNLSTVCSVQVVSHISSRRIVVQYGSSLYRRKTGALYVFGVSEDSLYMLPPLLGIVLPGIRPQRGAFIMIGCSASHLAAEVEGSLQCGISRLLGVRLLGVGLLGESVYLCVCHCFSLISIGVSTSMRPFL